MKCFAVLLALGQMVSFGWAIICSLLLAGVLQQNLWIGSRLRLDERTRWLVLHIAFAVTVGVLLRLALAHIGE